MQRILGWAALALGLVVCTAGAADKKGTVVTLDGLKSTTPSTWVKGKPKSKLRMMEFRLPRAKGDKVDADLGIFNIGGKVETNVKRWKDQFIPPKGKTIDDVAKVKEIKVGGSKATYVQLRGTYKAPFFDPKFGDRKGMKPKLWRNFRMLAVQFTGPEKGTYQIKLIGPSDTVEKYQKAFEDWLKGFKKD
jgi:hypothetical protein